VGVSTEMRGERRGFAERLVADLAHKRTMASVTLQVTEHFLSTLEHPSWTRAALAPHARVAVLASAYVHVREVLHETARVGEGVGVGTPGPLTHQGFGRWGRRRRYGDRARRRREGVVMVVVHRVVRFRHGVVGRGDWDGIVSRPAEDLPGHAQVLLEDMPEHGLRGERLGRGVGVSVWVDRDVLVRLGRVRAGLVGLGRALHGERQAVVPQARQELVLVEPEAEAEAKVGELHPGGWNGDWGLCLRLHRGVCLRLSLGLRLGLQLRLRLRLEWQQRLEPRHGLLTEHWHLRRRLIHLLGRCGRRKTSRPEVIRRDVGQEVWHGVKDEMAVLPVTHM
jgi:hypothetical protein